MWNYNFMLPSLLILAIIQCFYFAWPRLPVRMNRTFQAIILSDCLVIFFDLLSSRADSEYMIYSQAVLYFLNMGFFVMYLVRIYCFFAYTAAVLHIPFRRFSPGGLGASLVFLGSELITLSSFFTGAVFSIQADGYHKGPFYNLIYICFLFYIIYAFILLIRFRKRLSRHQFFSALAAWLILLAGNVVRILFPTYIVMNMFFLMAIFIMFLGFQNPALYRAYEGNAFNMRGLREMLEEKRHKGDFGLFAFALKDYTEERGLYGGEQMDKGSGLICQYMADRYPDQTLYYLLNGCFAVTGIDDARISRIHQDLLRRFREPWNSDNSNLYLRAGFVYLKPDKRFDSTEKIMDYLYAALAEASRSDRREEDLVDSSFFRNIEELTEVKRALERAVTEKAIEVYLMPIVDAYSGELKYAEALSRIRDRDGRIVTPDLFIPLAERSGQINEIGLQVLDKVCAFISSSHPQDRGMQWINVNLSPIQFLNRNLCGQFLEILNKYDVRPEQIHLEVTEQAMLDVHELKQQTDLLAAAGFRLSLDDYGKGYSNLSRLNSLPFADIKIDMEVVWDYCKKRDILLPSLISTLKKLGFSITAEGIETEEMAELMRGAGCDYLQGYLYSRPVPIQEFSR